MHIGTIPFPSLRPGPWVAYGLPNHHEGGYLGRTLITLAMFIYVVLTNKQKANASAIETLRKEIAEELEDLGKEIEDVATRSTRIETNLEHMPGHSDMGDIHNRVNETAQRLTSVEGELKQMNNTLLLINRHLISGDKK